MTRKQNVRDFSRDEVLGKVSTVMLSRHIQLAPCPVPPADFYRYCWTNEEKAAIRLLNKVAPTLLRRQSALTLDWDLPVFVVKCLESTAQRPVGIRVEFGEELPLPSTDHWRSQRSPLPISRLPEGMQDILETWAKKWVRLSIEKDEVYNKVNRVFSACNTMGQVYRIWPNVCSFLPERGQEVLRNAKVRSKLPEALIHYSHEDYDSKKPLLDRDWSPEALAPYDTIITEALLLPTLEEIAMPVTVVHDVHRG